MWVPNRREGDELVLGGGIALDVFRVCPNCVVVGIESAVEVSRTDLRQLSEDELVSLHRSAVAFDLGDRQIPFSKSMSRRCYAVLQAIKSSFIRAEVPPQ